jgi:hypothetical protein
MSSLPAPGARLANAGKRRNKCPGVQLADAGKRRNKNKKSEMRKNSSMDGHPSLGTQSVKMAAPRSSSGREEKKKGEENTLPAHPALP